MDGHGRWVALLVAGALALAACSAPQGRPEPAPGSPTGTRTAGAAPIASASGTPASSAPPSRSAVTPQDVASVPSASAPPAPTPASSPAAESGSDSPPPGSATEAGSATGFSGTISEIDTATADRMAGSWHPGCPVPPADLRYLTLTYRGFDGSDHPGELVVAASVAADVVAIFRQLYSVGYPIASLRLVDDFGGDDDASMAANNSSAFNCRPVTGGGGFSEHSYGTAIDLNPVQNPYLSGSLVLPEQGREYLDRRPGPGVILAGDAVVSAFAEHGWSWGGTWNGPIDYQHFSVSGR